MLEQVFRGVRNLVIFGEINFGKEFLGMSLRRTIDKPRLLDHDMDFIHRFREETLDILSPFSTFHELPPPKTRTKESPEFKAGMVDLRTYVGFPSARLEIMQSLLCLFC